MNTKPVDVKIGNLDEIVSDLLVVVRKEVNKGTSASIVAEVENKGNVIRLSINKIQPDLSVKQPERDMLVKGHIDIADEPPATQEEKDTIAYGAPFIPSHPVNQPDLTPDEIEIQTKEE